MLAEDRTSPSLSLNARMRFFRPRGSVNERLSLSIPVRGAGLRRLELERSRQPELFDTLVGAIVALRRGCAVGDLPGPLPSLLRDWGILVDGATEPGEVLFRCDLPAVDPAPGPIPEAGGEMPLCARVRLLPRGEAPAGVVLYLAHLAPHEELVWIDFAGQGVWLPFWPEPAQAHAIAGALALDRPIGALPGSLIASLAAAGALGSPGAPEGDRYCARRRLELPGLLGGPWLKALADYCREAIAQGYFERDAGSINQVWCHQDPITRLVHGQLAPLVSRLAGEPVKPSYTFTTSYLGGAVLEVHTDRIQCEHTISLLVDHAPAFESQSPWALWIVDPARGDRESCFQRRGDGLLFRGRELPHYRQALPLDHSSTSVLLHYVAQSFEGSLE
jgi:hypothetical protein